MRLRRSLDAIQSRRPRNTCPFAGNVDSEGLEIGFATRELVLERVNRLSAALDGMNEGASGTQRAERAAARDLHRVQILARARVKNQLD